MNNTAKNNLLQGRSMKNKSIESKLLYFVAIECADGSGLFDAEYALDAFNLPLTALMELVEAKLLLYFKDENVAAIVHWNFVAAPYQKGKTSIYPEVKNRLVVKNNKYYLKHNQENMEIIYET